MKKQIWLIVALVAALLLAACGPAATGTTPPEAPAATDTRTAQASPAATATQPEKTSPTESPPAAGAGETPVQADDWHVLGSPDAPVTMIEYSDFQ